MKKILAFLLGITFGVSLLVFITPQEQSNLPVGGFSPVGGLTYRLQTSAGSADTSINLSSLKNRSDIPLTMTVLDTDIGYGTLSPQTSRSEFISFTGITQNANGTAQLTGVLRGLSDISPFTASTTLRNVHPGQSIFILSDTPQLFEEYAGIRNDEAISGLYTFNTVLPTTSLTATTSEQFVTKGQLDSTTNQGAATSSETVAGISELATQIEMASSTDLGVNNPLVLQAKYATSSPDGTSQAGLFALISKNNGKLHQLWLDLAEAFTWTGTHIFNSTVDIEADAAANLTLNTIAYEFPSADGISGDALTTNSSGVLSWSTIAPFMDATTTAVTLINTTTETNLASTTILANILGTNGIVRMNIPITDFDLRGISGDNITLKAYYGATSISCILEQTTTTNIIDSSGWLRVYVMGADSASSQKIIVSIQVMDEFFDVATAQPREAGATCSTTSSIDSTSDNVFKVTATYNVASAQNSITADAMIAEKIK